LQENGCNPSAPLLPLSPRDIITSQNSLSGNGEASVEARIRTDVRYLIHVTREVEPTGEFAHSEEIGTATYAPKSRTLQVSRLFEFQKTLVTEDQPPHGLSVAITSDSFAKLPTPLVAAASCRHSLLSVSLWQNPTYEESLSAAD